MDADGRLPTGVTGLRGTTPAVQDYLKVIYKLQQRERPVSTMAIWTG